eukprot:TRINITY_DN441_c0_g1_i1.p5 TRINITY_DN441_c0_g1~~TRINITY_DN441_c0_g1_i1.p5  ORF type:complete len:170 (+),score=16.92 TRINITY_DN441_c0_g1_i1:1968-2477(+)
MAKLAIAFAFILLSTYSYGSDIESLPPEDSVMLTFGLLKGIGLKIIKEKVEECSWNIKDPSADIENALTHFETINWVHAVDIFEGTLRLIDVARNLFSQVTPCFLDDQAFMEFKNRISNLDFKQIFQKVIANGPKVFEYVKDIIGNWKGNNMQDFGETSGELIILVAQI